MLTAPFRINPATGWLFGVKRTYSPNFDARPAGASLDLIVVHGISLPPGEYGGSGIESLFLNCLDPKAHPYFREIVDLRVSSHALIRRDGELVQFVAFGDRAWHAGASCYKGRDACNNFAIGIELEGTDSEPYSDAQYGALVAVILALQEAYPSLRAADVVGHSDIAPGRKTDPGPSFDWGRLNRGLAAGVTAT